MCHDNQFATTAFSRLTVAEHFGYTSALAKIVGRSFLTAVFDTREMIAGIPKMAWPYLHRGCDALAFIPLKMEIMMKRILAFLTFACMAALTFVTTAINRVTDVAVSLLPDLVPARPSIMLNNGHPRSPLASLRAGVA